MNIICQKPKRLLLSLRYSCSTEGALLQCNKLKYIDQNQLILQGVWHGMDMTVSIRYVGSTHATLSPQHTHSHSPTPLTVLSHTLVLRAFAPLLAHLCSAKHHIRAPFPLGLAGNRCIWTSQHPRQIRCNALLSLEGSH